MKHLPLILLGAAVGFLAVWLWKTNKQLKATNAYAIAAGAQLDELN